MPTWFDAECNEWLKTRKGLNAMLEEAGDLPSCPVEDVVRFMHIDYNWPINML